MKVLGELYLDEGKCLVHGDFYPRSWLLTNKGAAIIDHEFGFKGLAEFDLGVFMAHLKMCQIPQLEIDAIVNCYLPQDHFDYSVAKAFAGEKYCARHFMLLNFP